jgi:hypothetical protein
MKKIPLLLLLLLIASTSFSQKKPSIPKLIAKIITKELTFDQHDFLKSVADKYPSFVFPKLIDNLYIDDQIIQSQYVLSDKSGNYEVIIEPDNSSLRYHLDVINIGEYSGQILKLGKTIIKTELITSKNEFNVYFDGVKEF